MVLAQNPVAHFCFLSSVRRSELQNSSYGKKPAWIPFSLVGDYATGGVYLLYCSSTRAESGSALLASSLQNFSAVGSAHSFSEAVFHLSLAFLGLVSSLHFRMHLTFAKYFPLRRFPLYIRKVLFVKGIFLFLNEKLGIFAFLFVNKL